MKDPTISPPERDPHRLGLLFWLSALIGAGVVGFGIRGAMTHLPTLRFQNLGVYFAASGILHDALWAPLIVAGAMATRWIVPWARPVVRAGLFFAMGFVLFVTPVRHNWPGRRSNPSALPLDYERNTVVGLMLLVTVVAVELARRARQRRRSVTP